MSPRPLPGVVFITGIVLGGIVSFIGIQMLSSSSSLVARMNVQTSSYHLVREIDVDLLCNISRRSARTERSGVNTFHDKQENDEKGSENGEKEEHRSPPISHEELEKQIEPKEEVHFADEHQHKGKSV